MTARFPDIMETVVVGIGDHEFRVMRCAYVAGEVRCGFAGTIASTTMNHGPRNDDKESLWYCRWHYDSHDPKYGAKVVEQSHQLPPPQQDGAEVLANSRGPDGVGFTHHRPSRTRTASAAYSVRCACAALRIEKPGEVTA